VTSAAALANNLRANAADMVKAVHGGTMICRTQPVKVVVELVRKINNRRGGCRVKHRL